MIVAQLVRASDCGSEGRGFETPHSPKASGFPEAFFIPNKNLMCGFFKKFLYKLVRKPNAMSKQTFIGNPISFKILRDYIFEHKINKGDSITLNPLNYHHIIEEIKNSGEESHQIPINVFGVRIIESDQVEIGKVQIIKNETLNN